MRALKGSLALVLSSSLATSLAVSGLGCVGNTSSGGNPRADASGPSIDGGTADARPDAGPPGARWTPTPGTTWQWQLVGAIDTSVDVDMYDVDLVETPQSTIDALQADGRIVICYFSAGTMEDFRSDAGAFPEAAIGEELPDWPGEFWLDVRHAGVKTALTPRLDLAVTKGCDGVEPDNVDAWLNDSGFPLTGDDQLAFNRWLADEAHRRGLSVGLKNDLDQIPELVADFDWALNEECFEYEECDTETPFIAANKAVFHVEYADNASGAGPICAEANRLQLSTLIKHLDLDAFRYACP